MKNKIWIIIVLLLILMPIKVGAASIVSVSMSSAPAEEQKVDSSFYIPITVNFSGIGNTVGETTGIWMVGLQLDFDDSILEIDQFYSDYFDTKIYKNEEENKYYVFSIADSDSTGNKCADNFLACSNKYEINIRFHVISNEKESVDIKLEEVGVGVFEVDTTSESYMIDDMEELEYTKEIIRTVRIRKEEEIIKAPTESVVTQEKMPEVNDNIIEESKKNHNSTSSEDDSSSNVNLSSNANLASLTIESYELNFKKNKQEYYIIVDKDTKSLNIKAVTEDEKATYQIIGADDLKEEVRIVVKAESEEEKTYIIKIGRRVENKSFINDITKKIKEIKITKETKKIMLIVGSALVVIIIIILIISRRNNKKIDKLLDEMD